MTSLSRDHKTSQHFSVPPTPPPLPNFARRRIENKANNAAQKYPRNVKLILPPQPGETSTDEHLDIGDARREIEWRHGNSRRDDGRSHPAPSNKMMFSLQELNFSSSESSGAATTNSEQKINFPESSLQRDVNTIFLPRSDSQFLVPPAVMLVDVQCCPWWPPSISSRLEARPLEGRGGPSQPGRRSSPAWRPTRTRWSGRSPPGWTREGGRSGGSASPTRWASR